MTEHNHDTTNVAETVIVIVAVAAAVVLIAVFVERMIQDGSILGPPIERENDGSTDNSGT